MKCAFCKTSLDGEKHGECALIAPNGNGVVARLCDPCLLEMGKFLDLLVNGGFAALENASKERDQEFVASLFVPPSVWQKQE